MKVQPHDVRYAIAWRTRAGIPARLGEYLTRQEAEMHASDLTVPYAIVGYVKSR